MTAWPRPTRPCCSSCQPVGLVLGDGQATGTIVNDDPGVGTPPRPSVATWRTGRASKVTTARGPLCSPCRCRGQRRPPGCRSSTPRPTAPRRPRPTTRPSHSRRSGCAAGETTKTVHVNVNGDTRPEANETVLLNLSAPGRRRGGRAGDRHDRRRGGPADRLRGRRLGCGRPRRAWRRFAFTVRLSVASDSTVSLKWATANGTAVAPGDYTAVAATVHELRHW